MRRASSNAKSLQTGTTECQGDLDKHAEKREEKHANQTAHQGCWFVCMLCHARITSKDKEMTDTHTQAKMIQNDECSRTR